MVEGFHEFEKTAVSLVALLKGHQSNRSINQDERKELEPSWFRE